MCRNKRQYIQIINFKSWHAIVCINTHTHTHKYKHHCTYVYTVTHTIYPVTQNPACTDTRAHAHKQKPKYDKNWSLLNQPKYFNQRQYLVYDYNTNVFTIKVDDF